MSERDRPPVGPALRHAARAGGRTLLTGLGAIAVVVGWILFWLIVPALVGSLTIGPRAGLIGFGIGVLVLVVDGIGALIGRPPLLGLLLRDRRDARPEDLR